MAFERNALAMTVYALLPMLLLRRQKRRQNIQEEVPKSAKIWAILFAIAFVLFLLTSVFLGWTKASNEWFYGSPLRPYIMALTWVILLMYGYIVLVKRHLSTNL